MKRKLKLRPILPLAIVGFAVCFSMAVTESREKNFYCTDNETAESIFYELRTSLESAASTLQDLDLPDSDGTSYQYNVMKEHIPTDELPLFTQLLEGRISDIILGENRSFICFELDTPPDKAYTYFLIYADDDALPPITQQHITDRWHIGFVGYT